jgi:hypothetical protein
VAYIKYDHDFVLIDQFIDDTPIARAEFVFALKLVLQGKAHGQLVVFGEPFDLIQDPLGGFFIHPLEVQDRVGRDASAGRKV